MKKIFISAIIILMLVILLGPIGFVSATYELEVQYPEIQGVRATNQLSSYLRYFYIYGLATIGLVALAALVFGGLTYMAAGSITSVEEAKKIIWGAIGGLLLGLSAYLILNTINPDLLKLKEPTVPTLQFQSQQRRQQTYDCPNYDSGNPCQQCDTSTGQVVNTQDGASCGTDKICQEGRCIETEGVGGPEG